jgi:hypothetical protein
MVPRNTRPKSEEMASISAHTNRKADVAEHPQALHHVGLLFNESPGTAGLPFI